jgi:ankyrin repeat protein
MNTRLPQTGVLAPTPSGVSAVPNGPPQFAGQNASDFRRSQLCAAARDGDATAVKRMLAAGDGNLNTTDPGTGMTALKLAACHGHGDVVFLLCKGASASDIHRDDARGGSALMLATAGGHIDVVEFLLGKAVPQQHKDRALAAVAMRGQVATIDLLVAHGARVDQPDAHGATPLYTATAYGHVAFVQALLKAGARVDCANVGGYTPLMMAA